MKDYSKGELDPGEYTFLVIVRVQASSLQKYQAEH